MPRLARRLVVLATLLAALPLGPRNSWAAEPAGKVESLRGEAYAQANAGRRPLAAAAEVFVGDLVATGDRSALSLRLGTATLIKLGTQARLRIDHFLVNAGGVLELAQGGMIYDHDPAAGTPDLSVRSPFGLIAVRGTRFFAGPSKGMFGVLVVRGAVRVTGAQTFVELGAELGTHIATQGGDPQRPHRWDPAVMQAAMASVE